MDRWKWINGSPPSSSPSFPLSLLLLSLLHLPTSPYSQYLKINIKSPQTQEPVLVLFKNVYLCTYVYQPTSYINLQPTSTYLPSSTYLHQNTYLFMSTYQHILTYACPTTITYLSTSSNPKISLCNHRRLGSRYWSCSVSKDRLFVFYKNIFLRYLQKIHYRYQNILFIFSKD